MRKQRRIALMVAVLFAVGVLLSACGQADQAGGGEDKLKVGLVFDVGGRGDLSFNDMAYEGLNRAAEEFGDRIEVKYLEPTGGGENREELLRMLAEEGYDLIFGVGFLFTEHIQKVAAEFPDTHFALIDGYIADLTEDSNVVCLLFKEHEGSFLVGAAAALATETNKIGFVGGMQIPLIERFEAGYHAGAKYINPDIEVLVDYIGTTSEAFKDPFKGKELAMAQYDAGADIVYHASGASGTGVFEAAVAKDKLAIGVDADQSLTASEEQRPHILTSMLKRVDVAVYNIIAAEVKGEYKGGYHIFGLADDGVGYAVNEYNEAMIEPYKAKLEELKQKIISGEIVVPVNNAELEQFLQDLGS